MHRQEERSATANFLFFLTFSPYSFEGRLRAPNSWKNVSPKIAAIDFFFQRRFKDSQRPFEGSLKGGKIAEEWHFLNEMPITVICGSEAAPLDFFVERCAMKDSTDFLTIKLLGIEASASGQFAIAALVLIAFALVAMCRRR